jgi:hypothetical protein
MDIPVKIQYADPPGIVIFEIEQISYMIEHDNSGRAFPYNLFQLGVGSVNAPNINEWLLLKTRGMHDLRHVLMLAQVWADGASFSYTMDDINTCAQKVFEFIKTKLFADGLAGLYAEQYSVECLSHDMLRKYLHAHDKLSDEQKRRHMRICRKRGYEDLEDGWERIIGDGVAPAPDVNTDGLDSGLLEGIRHLVSGLYRKNSVSSTDAYKSGRVQRTR